MKIAEDIYRKAQQWLDVSFDEETRNKVRYLIDNDPLELTESFYKNLEFGTGGLRGIMGVGTNRMNIYTVGMATQGLSNYLLKNFSHLKQIKVVIAHDCRNNGRLFAETTANVFTANGIKVYQFESLRPTPELSFSIRYYGCQSGVVVTASHNPKEYNGYKAYWDDGAQVIEPHDVNIINEVAAIKNISEVKFNSNPDLVEIIGEETDNAYLEQIKTLNLSPDAVKRQHDLKVVYTPLHGTGVKLVPAALRLFGFTDILNVPEQDISDGNFPTVKSPNPEEPSALQMAISKAVQEGAELVMATDPDADRVGIAVKDSKGEFVLLNGNQTATILVWYQLKKWSELGRLTGNEFIVKTIVTSELIAAIANKAKVRYFDTLTGFKYIADVIRQMEGKMKYIGGGEESFGYLPGDFVRDKDAVSTCALIAEIAAWAKDQGKSLFDILMDIYLEFGLYREHLISITKKGQSGSEEIRKMMENYRENPPLKINNSDVVMIKDYLLQTNTDILNNTIEPIDLPVSDVLQYLLNDDSKISVRPSGTEPKIKFYFEVNEPMPSMVVFDKINERLQKRILGIIKELGLS
ncbi:MAG: phospho-sugar mutase [Bacteroidia bacterium]|nr:phospho-sugar mutase [Bacteroidia bacterium]